MRLFILSLLFVYQLGFAAEKRIAVLIRPDYRGELSFAHRIKAASENLNWKADIFEIDHFSRLKKSIMTS